ncbi:MAG TPA: beta-ketoacyl-[acyl-carrier-protein] synthase family protein [bacterium]|nr:beta-ketoacyl-[acyl-carrier-protein] synthase family protein [bacterium]
MALIRPVVTGWGLVCPLGIGAEAVWESLRAGRGSGSDLRGPGWEACRSPRAAQVGPFQAPPGTEGRDRSLRLGVRAAQEAWDRSGLQGESREMATTFSSSKGGLLTLLQAREALRQGRPLPTGFLDEFSPGAPGLFLRDRLGLRGPVLSFAAACATGLASLIQAADWIEGGVAEAVLAGSAESSLHPLVWAGFTRMGLLTKSPEGGRPFDKDRDGFLLGEGAGAMVLESEDSAQRRGAPIRARLSGWALGADGEGILEVDPRGRSILEVIQRALRRAGLKPQDIGYINAHGTGTRANDKVEALALAEVFGRDRVFVSSTKGATGHLLGAAGSVEAVLAFLSLERGWAPPTRNLVDPDPECGARHVPPGGQAGDWRHVMSLSYGIGGQLGAVIFSRG